MNYNLSNKILLILYDYLKTDTSKHNFNLLYNSSGKIKIILDNEYNGDIAIKYLELGYYIKLAYHTNYFISDLDKYRERIYGCYIHTIHDLYKLKLIKHNLTHLKFNRNFNDYVYNYNLPATITHLIFGMNFNKQVDNLPETLQHLEFGYHFTRSVNNLPNGLTYLFLGHDFNKPVDNLPNTLKYLEFGMMFNQSIDKLPDSITHLKLGWMFNQHINKLPSNLKKLKLGYCFDHSIYILPITLKYLEFSNKYNKRLPPLPYNLKLIIANKNIIVNSDYNNHNFIIYQNQKTNNKVLKLYYFTV
jgi:hypothetical protein